MFKHAIEVHLCSVLQIAFPVQANLHPQKLLCVPVAIFLRIRIVFHNSYPSYLLFLACFARFSS